MCDGKRSTKMKWICMSCTKSFEKKINMAVCAQQLRAGTGVWRRGRSVRGLQWVEAFVCPCKQVCMPVGQAEDWDGRAAVFFFFFHFRAALAKHQDWLYYPPQKCAHVCACLTSKIWSKGSRKPLRSRESHAQYRDKKKKSHISSLTLAFILACMQY